MKRNTIVIGNQPYDTQNRLIEAHSSFPPIARRSHHASGMVCQKYRTLGDQCLPAQLGPSWDTFEYYAPLGCTPNSARAPRQYQESNCVAEKLWEGKAMIERLCDLKQWRESPSSSNDGELWDVNMGLWNRLRLKQYTRPPLRPNLLSCIYVALSCGISSH